LSEQRIASITVTKKTIDIALDGGSGEYTVSALVPVVCGDPKAEFAPGRVVASYDADCKGGVLSVPRFAGEYDCIICAFEVSTGGVKIPGVRYVTEIALGVAEYDYPYPKKKIKALGCPPEDVDILGIEQCGGGANQMSHMTTKPAADDIKYMYNGKPYYFKKEAVESTDKYLRAFAEKGVVGLNYLSNSSFFLGEDAEDELIDIIQHPAFDYDFDAGFMGGFNVRTEEGLDYFCAFIEFIAERYSREDQKYGCCLSFSVGNEVTSQYIWANAGEMSCEEYMLEYTGTLRLVWLLASKHYANFRIFTSFDQYFAGRHVPEEPKRYYGMKECIDNIAGHCKRDGDFPWNVGFHPYPENLSFPDFYHDREPNWTFETRRITFKNIEVMPAYLAQKHLLYKGEPRRIILTEQGFNTRTDEPFTELEAAHGYCLAYLKIRNIPTIDYFTHHAYVDNPGEFGLNLGIRRFGSYGENNSIIPGEPKPTYYVMRDMDTPAEWQRVQEARAFIGPMLFDHLLNPPKVTPKRDSSRDGLVREGVGNKKGKKRGKKKGTVQTNFDT